MLAEAMAAKHEKAEAEMVNGENGMKIFQSCHRGFSIVYFGARVLIWRRRRLYILLLTNADRVSNLYK